MPFYMVPFALAFLLLAGANTITAAAVAPVAADTGKMEPMSIIDLAAADGKYGTLLSAVTNTPGVLDAVAASFPVSKLVKGVIHCW